jgi:hypothetical protein
LLIELSGMGRPATILGPAIVERVWILQEVAVPQDRVILGCGNCWIPCTVLEKSIDLLAVHVDNAETILCQSLSKGMDWLLNSFDVCRHHRAVSYTDSSSSGQPLETLSYLTGHFHASDPRDNIYALLGLARDEDRMSISPDYTKPLPQLLHQTVEHIINHTGRLNILSGNRSLQLDCLSSWMPAFSDPVRRGYG